ncbi:hypothetical protein HD554DRAFT_2039908 [Boletus coccyginus]|nr:hypothetical protein HD554DRAFT_2039908 [Boletus coccyginus]
MCEICRDLPNSQKCVQYILVHEYNWKDPENKLIVLENEGMSSLNSDSNTEKYNQAKIKALMTKLKYCKALSDWSNSQMHPLSFHQPSGGQPGDSYFHGSA